MKHLVTASACALVLFTAVPALAQQPSVAVTATTSGVGLHVQAGSRLALRPEFSFVTGSSESDTSLSTTVKAENTSVGLGLSAPLYFKADGPFRTYVSPQFDWRRSSSKIGTTESPARSQYSAGGSFGADYRASDRFMMFGEVGVAHSWYSTEATSLGSATTLKTNMTGTRALVGVGFFF